jgi:retinol dehydrogenase-12
VSELRSLQNDALDGSVALVTGATSGIGFYTALALATRGAHVFVTGRDAHRGEAAATALRKRTGNRGVHFIATDHATIAGNRELAERVSGAARCLNVLVNNVGGAVLDRLETADDHELTVAVNFLGPAVLTAALIPLLCQRPRARVVNVVCSAHVLWKGDPFRDLESRECFRATHAFARAKVLNLLWTFALARRLEKCGVTANAVDPGRAWTRGTQSLMPELASPRDFVWPLVREMQRRRSAAAAAKVSAYCAASRKVAGLSGWYFESDARRARPSGVASDPVLQERAWQLGEAWIGCAFKPDGVPGQ